MWCGCSRAPHWRLSFPFSTDAPLNKRTFNYNLSKARRVVENAFGDLKARFRRAGKGLDSHYKNNAVIIMACCVFHNILNNNNSVIDESWKAAMGDADKEQPDQSNTSGDFITSAEAKFLSFLLSRNNWINSL